MLAEATRLPSRQNDLKQLGLALQNPRSAKVSFTAGFIPKEWGRNQPGRLSGFEF